MALPPVGRRTLRAAYDRALAEGPDDLAQLDRTARYTTAESHDRSLRVAGGFGALGVVRYFFSDRMKDALRRRGENVSSFEVERVINEHPDVYESAVVAVPSTLTEDDIKAVVVPREGASIDPTQKVHKHLLRESGTSGWDREAAGIVVRRVDSRGTR